MVIFGRSTYAARASEQKGLARARLARRCRLLPSRLLIGKTFFFGKAAPWVATLRRARGFSTSQEDWLQG